MIKIREIMSRLRNLFTAKVRLDQTPTLYSRDTGPICYEVELFGDNDGLTDFVQALLSSGLDWYWASVRQYEPIEEYKTWNLPTWRSSTRLTRETSDLLYQDFLEEDIDDTKRAVDLIGVEVGRELPTNESEFRKAIDDFLSEQNLAIKVIINRICDTRPLYIFAPQEPVPELANLLNRWSLRKDTVNRRRGYRGLHLAKLEDMKDGIAKLFVNTHNSSDAEP